MNQNTFDILKKYDYDENRMEQTNIGNRKILDTVQQISNELSL